MRTNFKHLEKYPQLYTSAVEIEQNLLTVESQEEMKNIGNQMRRLLEGLIGKMIKKYAYGCEERGLRNRCEYLYSIGAIDRVSWENMLKFMRMGNECSHFGHKTKIEELKIMYQYLYEESYKIATYYLNDKGYEAYLAYRRNHNNALPMVKATPARNTSYSSDRYKPRTYSKRKEPTLLNYVEAVLAIVFGLWWLYNFFNIVVF